MVHKKRYTKKHTKRHTKKHTKKHTKRHTKRHKIKHSKIKLKYKGGVPLQQNQSVKFILKYDLQLRVIPQNEDDEPYVRENLSDLDREQMKHFIVDNLTNTINNELIVELYEIAVDENAELSTLWPIPLSLDDVTARILNEENNKLELEFDIELEEGGELQEQLLDKIRQTNQLPRYMRNFYYDYNDRSDLIFNLREMQIN
jgi:hypothetical protein